jgi:hypothetical protein
MLKMVRSYLSELLSKYLVVLVSVDAWAECVRFLLCKCRIRTGGLSMQEEDFVRIAKLLRRFFEDVRGWTISDIATGMSLVNGEFVLFHVTVS